MIRNMDNMNKRENDSSSTSTLSDSEEIEIKIEVSDSEASSFDSSDQYSFLIIPIGTEGFFGEFLFQMRIFGDRGYFLPFELICLAFTIACCFIGAYSWPLCPANVYIPRYVFFNGAIATFSVCIEVMGSLWKLVMRRYGGLEKYVCAFGFGWIALITTLIEMAEFYTMSYSFQKNEENYCDETFYWFVYYKNIASGILLSLVAMIYIPNIDFAFFYYV